MESFARWLAEVKIPPTAFTPKKWSSNGASGLSHNHYATIGPEGDIVAPDMGSFNKNPYVNFNPHARSIDTQNVHPQADEFRKMAGAIRQKYGPDADSWKVKIYGPSHAETGRKNKEARSLKYWMNQPQADFRHGPPEFLYHGTSTNLWQDGISQKGLMPRSMTGNSGSFGTQGDSLSRFSDIYLSVHPDAATREAARQAANQHGGQPLILKIATHGLFPEKFHGDEDSRSDDAIGSAVKMGTVAYRGRIPFTLIQPFLLGEKENPKSHRFDKWVAYRDVPLQDHPLTDRLRSGRAVSDYDTPLFWALFDAGVLEKREERDSWGSVRKSYHPVRELSDTEVRTIIKSAPWVQDAQQISRDFNSMGMQGLKSANGLTPNIQTKEDQEAVDLLVKSGIYVFEHGYLSKRYFIDHEHIIALAKMMRERGIDYRDLAKRVETLAARPVNR